jgi:hypothetical protein
VIFVLLLIWLLPKLWRAIKYIFKKIGALFGGAKPAPLRAEIPGGQTVAITEPN